MNWTYFFYLVGTLLFVVTMCKQFMIIVLSPKGDDLLASKVLFMFFNMMILSATWLLLKGAEEFAAPFFIAAAIIASWVYFSQTFPIINIKISKMAETTTTFGIPSLSKATPAWAKWSFRVTFLLTTVATFIIAGDPSIPDDTKVRIGVYLKGLDMFIYGLSKMVGVEVKEESDT